jgi:hypothetical protein
VSQVKDVLEDEGYSEQVSEGIMCPSTEGNMCLSDVHVLEGKNDRSLYLDQSSCQHWPNGALNYWEDMRRLIRDQYEAVVQLCCSVVVSRRKLSFVA